ncbi:MAG: CARDB domain-containing protein [bacterium]
MKKIIPLLFSIFMFPDIDWNFQVPSGLSIDKADRIYVASSGSCRIKRYASDGRLSLEFGERGEDDGYLDGPMDVAVNSKGDIYVADTWNNRISVFSPDGTFKMNIGGLGEGKGRFKYPNSIAIDKDDYLYVVDSGNAVIQKFSSNGRFIMEFGKKEGLKWPCGIAIDEDLYISDTGNNRIMRFSQDGGFIESIRGIDNPRGIAFSFDKSLYVACSSSIMKLVNNEFVPFIKGLSHPMDIVFTSSSIFVSEGGENRVLKFSLGGIFESEWRASGKSLERLNLPYDVALGKENMYIADTGNNRVLCLDSFLKPKRVWDVPSPIAIFVDSYENIYCVSSRENVVIKFDNLGNEMLRLENLISPRDLLVDDKEEILILTSSDVLRFSSLGSLLGTLCTGLKDPSCITRDNFGFILVSDGNTIKRFSQSGILIKTIENLQSPSGIAIDEDDNIYVAEREKNCILKLDFYGKIIDVINNPKFLYPYGLTLDNDGGLYIADCGNHRIVVFGKKRFFEAIKEKEVVKSRSNLADLIVSKIEVLEPNLGIWTNIKATIKNEGDVKADFISVGFFCNSSKIGFGKIIKTLNPGETIIINTIWLPEEIGTQTIKVVVNQEDKTKEENKENNIKEIGVFVY